MKKFFCWLVLGLALVGAVYAASVTLGWDYNNPIDGFGIYYGPASRTYTNEFDVGGTNRMATVSNLVNGALYFFAATAFNGQRTNVASFFESDFSDEVSYLVPPPPGPAPPGGLHLGSY